MPVAGSDAAAQMHKRVLLLDQRRTLLHVLRAVIGVVSCTAEKQSTTSAFGFIPAHRDIGKHQGRAVPAAYVLQQSFRLPCMVL